VVRDQRGAAAGRNSEKSALLLVSTKKTSLLSCGCLLQVCTIGDVSRFFQFSTIKTKIGQTDLAAYFEHVMAGGIFIFIVLNF
jgi:hypothetical protein